MGTKAVPFHISMQKWKASCVKRGPTCHSDLCRTHALKKWHSVNISGMETLQNAGRPQMRDIGSGGGGDSQAWMKN